MKSKYSWHDEPTLGSREEGWAKLWRLAISVVAFAIAFAIEFSIKLWKIEPIQLLIKIAVAMCAALFVLGIGWGVVESILKIRITKFEFFYWWLVILTGLFLWVKNESSNLKEKIEELESRIDELESRIDELESRNDDLESPDDSDDDEEGLF